MQTLNGQHSGTAGKNAASVAPEAELLLLLLRAEWDSDAGQRAEEILKGGLDWDDFLAKAEIHRILPGTALNLLARFTPLLPSHIAGYLHQALLEEAERNRGLVTKLVQVAELFAKGGVAYAAMKGPVLAHTVYEKPETRQIADLDLLVRRQDLDRCRRLLPLLGFHSRLAPGSVKAKAWDRYSREESIHSVPEQIILRLQWDVLPSPFAVRMDLDTVSTYLTTIPLLGGKVTAAAPEILLLLTCVRASWRHWSQLKWVADCDRLVRAGGLNWSLVLNLADRFHCRRKLGQGLRLAQQLLASPVPEPVVTQLAQDSGTSQALSRILPRLRSCAQERSGRLARLASHLSMEDSARRRIAYLARLALQPQYEDWVRCPLPESLDFLYSALRPWGLLRERLPAWSRIRPVSFHLGPFVPTPMELVDAMLNLAQVTPADVVYDLGCGDGRIAVRAAERFGARAVGVDNNEDLLETARERARRSGVESLTQFRCEDALTTELSGATVVTIYVLPESNLKLKPKLLRELPPGARIVSRAFTMGDWSPERVEVVEYDGGQRREKIFLWRTPARNQDTAR